MKTLQQGGHFLYSLVSLEVDLNSATLYPKLCEGQSLEDAYGTNIIFNLIDGATNPSVSGLPNNINWVVEDHDNDPSTPLQLIIFGTVDPNNVNDVYPFVVTAQNSNGQCFFDQRGEITINRPDELSLVNPGFDSQTVCEGQQIDDITYYYGGGATGVNISWTIQTGPTETTSSTPRVVFQLFLMMGF